MIDFGGFDIFLDNLIVRLHNDSVSIVSDVIDRMVLPELRYNFLTAEASYPTKLGGTIDNTPRPTYGRITTGVTYEPTMRLVNSLRQQISPTGEIEVGTDVEYALAQEYGWQVKGGEFFPGKHFFEKTVEESDKFIDEIVDRIFEQIRRY